MAQANTQKPIRVLGIAGSLRRKSYNRAALRAAQELAPDDMRLENFDLSEIPLYNSDLETEGPPAPVQEFRDRLAAADAVLIVTPEYNYSLNRPQVFISRAPEKFDEEGRLIDEQTGLQIRSLLEALVVWARRLQSDERV